MTIYNGIFSVENTSFEVNMTTDDIKITGFHKEARKIDISDFYTSIIKAYNICPTLDLTDTIEPSQIDRTIHNVYELITADGLEIIVMGRGENSYSTRDKLFEDVQTICDGKSSYVQLFSRLSTRLKTLVQHIASYTLINIVDFINRHSGTVVRIRPHTVYYLDGLDITERMISEFTHGYWFVPGVTFDIKISKIDVLFIGFHKTIEYVGGNMILGPSDYNGVIRYALTYIFESFLKSDLNYLNQETLNGYIYDIYTKMVNGETNNLFTIFSRLGQYESNTYFIKAYIDKLNSTRSSSERIRYSSKIEYQFVVLPNEIGMNAEKPLFYEKMSEPSESNKIDYCHYLSKIGFVYNGTSDTFCTPIDCLRIYTNMKDEVPTFELFQKFTSFDNRIDFRNHLRRQHSLATTVTDGSNNEVEIDVL